MSDLTHLRLHDVVDCFGRPHRVAKLNDCRALIIPLKRKTETFTPQTGEHAGKPVTFVKTEDGHGISPNSPLEILGRYNPATGEVAWHAADDPVAGSKLQVASSGGASVPASLPPLDVGCSMLNVGCSPSLPPVAQASQPAGALGIPAQAPSLDVGCSMLNVGCSPASPNQLSLL